MGNTCNTDTRHHVQATPYTINRFNMTLDLDQALFFIYPDINVLTDKYPACSSTKELLTAALKEIQKFFGNDQEYKEYFWHDEGIHWEIMDKSSHPFISGKIKFGDGMEDEWFILKLLLKLSSVDTSLVASIFDTDGDFVLIEAAEVLPEWLEPETSKNRVFIHEGSIKIIPISLQSDQPQLHEALKLLRTGKTEAAAAALNRKIMKVLEPKLLEEQKLHKAKVVIPLDIAKVLKIKKQLIGPAISSFYNREEGCALALSKFKNQSTSITTVPMTRIQFAQLACQELANTKDSLNFDNPIAGELGMKLTFGFEILMASDRKFIEKFEDSVPSVQDEIRIILSREAGDSEEFFNNEPEDSLAWMEIDETVLDSDLQSKLEQLSMTEMEQSDLIETWTKEFDGGNGKGKAEVSKLKEGISEIDEIVEKMKKMIESTSNFEGIELEDQDNEDNEDSEDNGDGEDFDNYSENSEAVNSENDEELIEREIFETINFDPDLLMKIVEANSRAGASNVEFLARFRKYQDENPKSSAASPSRKQKGLADIEGAKVEEARKSSRKIVEVEADEEEGDSDSDMEEEEDGDSDMEGELEGEEDELDMEIQVEMVSEIEDADEFIYGQTFDQFKASNFAIDPESEDDDSDDSSENMKDYYSAMDNELSASLLTASDDSKLPARLSDPEIRTNLGKNLIESMAAAGRGNSSGGGTPIETIITGLGKKVPKPDL